MDQRRFSPGGTHGLTTRFIPFMISVIVVAVVMTLPISTYAQGPSGEKTRPEPLTPSPTSGRFVPGEILVKFKPGIGALSAENVIRGEGLQTLDISPYSGIARVQVEPGREIEIIAKLMARSDVEIAEPNYIMRALENPNDTYYVLGYQWGLAQIQAPQAWDISTGDTSIIIAVIDTGVDLSHPDLSAKIVSGYDFVGNDSTPQDGYGHGTHVAGIAAAVTNNGIGVAGVSWGARIMPVRVLDNNGMGTLNDVIDGMIWAANNGADILNLSLGGEGDSDMFASTINTVRSKGVLIVAAAGNCGDPATYYLNGCTVHNPSIYPAANSGVFAVGATTPSDTRASFSNYGSYLDIAAPGVNIYSTFYNSYSGSHTYASFGGTSMATPFVSGLAALVWSMDHSLTNDQVQNIIQSTADDPGPAGQDPEFGYGRINAWRALESLINLQISPEQIGFLVDDDSGPFPASKDIQITTTSPTAINWAANISPPVSWLSIAPPASGTVSAASAASFTLVASRPAAYGTYTTQVVVTGTMPSGGTIGPEIIQVHISYIPDLYEYRFPAIFKNYAP